MLEDNNRFEPYWATVGPTEIAERILDRVEDYYQYLSFSGRMDLYQRSWLYYYRARTTGARLNPVGQQGELTAMVVNDYRNLLVHLETMTTQQRANFEPKATNSDAKSQAQVILASCLLDYYMREKRLERNFKQSVKEGLMLGESFLRVEWDATLGKTYGMSPTGAPIYEGDVKYTNYGPLDTIRDYTKTAASNEDWTILRDFQNKHILAAKFPDLHDRILEDSNDALELSRTTTLHYLQIEDSDNIAVYTLLHAPTPAIPRGRFTMVLDNGTVLMDGPLPYEKTHVYRLAPDEEIGTIFGYTVGFDLLPVQEAIDVLISTVVTNQATFGVQNILVPKGHDLSTAQMSGGLNVMEYDSAIGKPEALNLTYTAPEIFEFIKMLREMGETISGVNSVARGNPEASLKSGAALALIQSMAVQFSMGLQQSYAQLLEDVGTATVEILQVFAAVPRVAEITGKSNRPLMREFKGQDLNEIKRVEVDMGNPVMRTTAGKTNLADAYLEHGWVDNPDQYVQVVTTGRLEPLIEGTQANLLLIKGENEQLAEGVPQRALITDEHAKHILEHSTVLANPEIRQDPNNPIVQATLAHIQEHINFAQSPFYQMIAASLKHELAMAPAPMPMAPQDGGTGQMLDGTPPVVQQAQDVQQPNMPAPPQGTDAQSAAVIEGQSA